MSLFSILTNKIEELVKIGKPKIAFGLLEPNREILESLEKSKEYADIILIGPEAIKNVNGFKKIITDKPSEKITSMLVSGEVEGIIRGTIDDFATYDAYQKLVGKKIDVNPGIMEDPIGRQFLLSPASNPEGWEKEEQLRIGIGMAEFLKQWGIEPKIGVFTAIRHDTYKLRKDNKEGVQGYLNKTYENAEWLVSEFGKKGYQVKNWVIEMNPAIEEGYNVIIPVNGMVGNQILRAIMFCGGKILACPRLGLDHCYEDDSRTEKDFLPHVKWLVAWINSKKQ
jgi:predicted methyltransferase MtxX (methanogen marker protein 4)